MKLVGENKHFHMIFIYEKFNNLNEKKLSTTQLWDHLGQLYDLQELVLELIKQKNKNKNKNTFLIS